MYIVWLDFFRFCLDHIFILNTIYNLLLNLSIKAKNRFCKFNEQIFKPTKKAGYMVFYYFFLSLLKI